MTYPINSIQLRLDTLGLVGSLRGLCREFSGPHKLQVEFLNDGILGQIPKGVTVCLFRITQEALRNVVKHSGAASAEVELSGNADEIELYVSDSGRGFDVESVKGVAGLGLISMRERLRLSEEICPLNRTSHHGTRIRARIPQVAMTERANNRNYQDPDRRSP